MIDRFMQRAIVIARQSIVSKSGGPFGAVIVKNSRIVGEGSNCVTSKNDPTAHAEIVAIRHACEALRCFSLKGTTLYTTCEPCPMCYGAIFWARIDEIIYAANRDGAAQAGFDDSNMWDDVARVPPLRHVKMRHVPSPDADSLFAQWLATPDRTPY